MMIARYDPYGYDGCGAFMEDHQLGDYVEYTAYEALYEKYKQLCDMMDALTEEG